MSLLSSLDIINSIAEVAVEAWDSSNRKEVSIAASDNQRKIENTKTIVGGAVLATGIAGLAYVASKAIENSTSTKITTPFGSLETNNTPSLESGQDSITIDHDSVWIDQSKNEFGADLVDKQSGSTRKIAYQVRKTGDKVYQIFESVNGEKWMPTGVVDWNTMGISDLGAPANGGPIFAEIVPLAFRLSQG